MKKILEKKTVLLVTHHLDLTQHKAALDIHKPFYSSIRILSPKTVDNGKQSNSANEADDGRIRFAKLELDASRVYIHSRRIPLTDIT